MAEALGEQGASIFISARTPSEVEQGGQGSGSQGIKGRRLACDLGKLDTKSDHHAG